MCHLKLNHNQSRNREGITLWYKQLNIFKISFLMDYLGDTVALIKLNALMN